MQGGAWWLEKERQETGIVRHETEGVSVASGAGKEGGAALQGCEAWTKCECAAWAIEGMRKRDSELSRPCP